jgi:hypothetical protein
MRKPRIPALNRWERRRDCARSRRRKADARRGEVSGRDVQRRDAGGWARWEHASTARRHRAGRSILLPRRACCPSVRPESSPGAFCPATCLAPLPPAVTAIWSRRLLAWPSPQCRPRRRHGAAVTCSRLCHLPGRRGWFEVAFSASIGHCRRARELQRSAIRTGGLKAHARCGNEAQVS